MMVCVAFLNLVVLYSGSGDLGFHGRMALLGVVCIRAVLLMYEVDVVRMKVVTYPQLESS